MFYIFLLYGRQILAIINVILADELLRQYQYLFGLDGKTDEDEKTAMQQVEAAGSTDRIEGCDCEALSGFEPPDAGRHGKR